MLCRVWKMRLMEAMEAVMMVPVVVMRVMGQAGVVVVDRRAVLVQLWFPWASFVLNCCNYKVKLENRK